jgi:hypothetical protein
MEGGNVRIDIRWSEGEAERVSAYAAELIGISPNVLVASSPAHASGLRNATVCMWFSNFLRETAYRIPTMAHIS